MSASREKKNRQELAAQGHVDPKAERAAKEAAEQKKNRLLYGGIAVLFVIVAAVVLLYNSGIFQRRGFLFTEAVACTFIANRNGISGVQQQPQQRPVAHAKSDDGNGFPPKRTYIRIQCHGCLPIIFFNLCIIFGFWQKFNTYRVDKRIGSG